MAEHRDTLASLVMHIREQARERDAAAGALGLSADKYPELPAVEEFRRLWADQRQQAQLRALMQPPPADAGPLNSASLAHRALAAMRDSSPGYLQHFMTWLDALAWLDRLQAPGGQQKETGTRRAGQGKRDHGGKRKAAR